MEASNYNNSNIFDKEEKKKLIWGVPFLNII